MEMRKEPPPLWREWTAEGIHYTYEAARGKNGGTKKHSEQGKPSNYARDDTFLNLTFSRNRVLDTVFMRKRNARKKTEGSINIPALIKFPHFSLTLPFSSGQYQSTLHSG